MKDTTKGFVLGILFGVGISVGAGAAVVSLVIMPKTAAAIADARTAQETADNQKWSTAIEAANRVSAETTRRMLATQQVVDSNQVPAGFTALLEPAPAKSASALQLFDVVRPGLGTMLAKMQSAQSPQIAVRWVVAGHVKALSNSPGYSYCWLNGNGEVDSANCPVVSQ